MTKIFIQEKLFYSIYTTQSESSQKVMIKKHAITRLIQLFSVLFQFNFHKNFLTKLHSHNDGRFNDISNLTDHKNYSIHLKIFKLWKISIYVNFYQSSDFKNTDHDNTLYYTAFIFKTHIRIDVSITNRYGRGSVSTMRNRACVAR